MSTACGPDAEAVTRGLGFDCHDVSPVVSVRPPWALAHWTMPLLEVLIVGGPFIVVGFVLFRVGLALRRKPAPPKIDAF